MSKVLIVFLGVFVVFTFSSNAQMMVMSKNIDDYEVLDTSILVVRYSLDFIVDEEEPENIDSDIRILEIGTKLSKSYSYRLFKHDSILTAHKGSSGVPFLQVAVPPVQIFKNYPSNKNTVIHRAPLSAPVFLYMDNLEMQWEILPERKVISGYTCQKAITTFRGRTWEAWFTNQIPFSNGPWKFQGLPGLILQVADNQKHYQFTCIGISKEEVLIKKWKWNYERQSRKSINSLLERYAERPYVVGKQIGIKFGFIDSALKDKSIPFNPLELE